MNTPIRTRLLSALMALVMLLSLLPTAAFAADTESATATKITSADQLVTGQYVLVANNGYAPTVLDSGWIQAAEVTDTEGSVTVDPSLLWTLTVAEDGVTLTDSNGVSIAPKGGNTNGIQSGEYKWTAEFAEGTFTFAGTGSDTVKLASNTANGNKFRAYKNGTISGNPGGYPCDFTLYQLSATEPTDPTEPSDPIETTGPSEPEPEPTPTYSTIA